MSERVYTLNLPVVEPHPVEDFASSHDPEWSAQMSATVEELHGDFQHEAGQLFDDVEAIEDGAHRAFMQRYAELLFARAYRMTLELHEKSATMRAILKDARSQVSTPAVDAAE